MRNSKTLLRSDESVKKQPKLPVWAYEYLRDRAHELTRGWSKGVVLYEVIMMCTDAHEDDITRYEEMVDEQLLRYADLDFLVELEKIKLSSHPSHSLPIDYDLTDNPVEMWLPEPLVKDISEPEYWGERYWDEHIDAVLREYMDSAFDSRLDRIACKRDMIAYLDTGARPDHSVTLAVVDNDSIKYDVDAVHKVLQEVEELDWWEREDLTFDDIKDMQSTDQAISSHNKKDRLEAFYNAFSNEPLTERQTLKKMMNLFDIGTESYARENYLELFEEEYSQTYAKSSVDDVNVPDDVGLGQLPQYKNATRAEQAVLLDTVFRNIGSDKLRAERLAQFLQLAGWVDDVDNRTVISFVKELNKDYGIDSYRTSKAGVLQLNS